MEDVHGGDVLKSGGLIPAASICVGRLCRHAKLGDLALGAVAPGFMKQAAAETFPPVGGMRGEKTDASGVASRLQCQQADGGDGISGDEHPLVVIAAQGGKQPLFVEAFEFTVAEAGVQAESAVLAACKGELFQRVAGCLAQGNIGVRVWLGRGGNWLGKFDFLADGQEAPFFQRFAQGVVGHWQEEIQQANAGASRVLNRGMNALKMRV